jgi:hypothetical protein
MVSPFPTQVIGASPSGGGGGYNPQTSAYTGLATAQQAPASNLENASSITAITNLIDSLNRSAQTSANQARVPNAPALEQASSGNIGSELSGQIPASVLAQIGEAAGERGVATGSPGSPNANAAWARALGLTSLDLTNMGQQNLSAAYARNPAAPLYDPSQMLLSPAQAGSLGLQGAELGLNASRAGGGGGGGGRGGGGYSQPTTSTASTPYYGSYATGDEYTPTPGFNSPDAATASAAWLNSILGPNTPTTTGSGLMIINGQAIDPNTGQPVPTVAPDQLNFDQLASLDTSLPA